MAPERICRAIGASLLSQFFKGLLMAVFFEMVDDSSADNAINVSMYVPRLFTTVGYKVSVIGHDHVGEQEKIAGSSCFIDRIAGDFRDRIGAENR